MRKSSLLGVALVLTLGFGCPASPAPSDAGVDASRDAASPDAFSVPDAYSPDAWVAPPVDAGHDAGSDAGPPPYVGPVGAIRAGHLIDPLDGTVTDDAVIVFTDGRVSYVGTDESQIPAEATVLDWSAFTVIPGMVDTHVHFTYLTDNAPGTYPWSHWFEVPDLMALAREAAMATLRTGVTTAVDKGSPYFGIAQSLKAEIADGTTTGPRIFTAGGGVFQYPGGGFHGVDEVRAEVRRQITEEHVDLIKLWADGCSDQRLTCDLTFTAEEMIAAVEEAHSLDTPVSIHAYHADGADRVIQAAPDTLEHSEGLTPEQLTALVDNNITYIPTIDHNRYYRDNIRAFGYPPETYAAFTDYIQENLQTATAAQARGVRMAMGSDAVFSGFGQNTGEVLWFAQTGMTQLQVLQAATIRGAETIREEHQIGRLAVDYFADAVAIEGDPLMDPAVLVTGVRGVVAAGAAIDHRTLR